MRFGQGKSGIIYKVAMPFWINICGCQLYPRHGHLCVNQLKNDSYCQPLYIGRVLYLPSAPWAPSWSRHFQSRPLTTLAPITICLRTCVLISLLCLLSCCSASLAALPKNKFGQVQTSLDKFGQFQASWRSYLFDL